jgi:DNA-binding transcriptional regulator YhcF (GntR family)
VFVLVDPTATTPMFVQIATSITTQIATGTIATGARLPAAKDLADSLGVNVHTVLRAYQELRDEGQVELRRGRGVRVMTGRVVDHAAARRAALIATIWVPLAIVVASEAVVIGVGGTGSPRLIVHWGAGGDRYGPWWTYAILVAAIGLPVIALIGFFIARSTRMAGMNAWMPAIAMAITVFHTVGMGVGSVVLNRSPLAPALPLGGGVALAVAAGLLTWWLLPREAAVTASVEAADTMPVRHGEVVAWTGKVELAPWFLTLIAVVAAVLVVLGVLLFLTLGWHVWPIFLAPALMLTALLTTAQFVVTAGPRGFVVRSTLGWPRLSVPACDLAAARVVQVDPMADFGGWGIRWVIGPRGKGRWGIATRSGPGVEVIRRDGRSIVVTVDDAGTAAAVLETYAREQA